MTDRATVETSEDCLLDRHGACKGEVMMASTSKLTLSRPCACFCHELEGNRRP